MIRGGQPEKERQHAKVLIEGGAEKIWGWDTPAGAERVRARVEWLAKHCNLEPGTRVLECGCGTGIFTRHLSKTGALITGVDISDELLNQARKACPDSNVSFLQANLEDPTRLPDNFFDAMYGVSVLHHLALDKALPQLRSKLKPGARFAFSEPNIFNPINKYVLFVDDSQKRARRGVSPTEMAFTPEELREAFEKAGYVVHSVCHRDFLHPSLPRLMIPLAKIAQTVLEGIPMLARWSGSLWIHGEVPS